MQTRPTRILTALAAAAALAGCTNAADGSAKAIATATISASISSADETAQPTRPAPDQDTATPFGIGADPLWNNAKVPFDKVLRARFLDDVAVLSGTVEPRKAPVSLAVVDAETGAARWSVKPDDPLTTGEQLIPEAGWLLVGDQILIGYRADCRGKGCDDEDAMTIEFGIAALSLDDGTVNWLQPVIPPVERDSRDAEKWDGRSVLLVGAGERAAIVNVGSVYVTHFYEEGRADDVSTLALDPGTGDELWNSPGTIAVQLAGDHVLLRRPPTGSTVIGGPDDVLVSAAPATGELQWNRDTPVRIDAANGTAAVVHEADRQFDVSLIDLASGDDLASLSDPIDNCVAEPDPAQNSLADAEEPLLVCTVQVEPNVRHLISYRNGEDDPWISDSATDALPYKTIGGRVFARLPDPDPGLDPDAAGRDEFVVLDRSARVLNESLPGRLVTVENGFAVFDTGVQTPSYETPRCPCSFEVYPVSGER